MCSIDRLGATRRSSASLAGYQHWSDLLFIHWQVPAVALQSLLPRELTVDTWEGMAWVGLVPFRMSGVRPWWCPPVYGVPSFPETNVRTYVHNEGRDPGVWFFSLDAAHLLAVKLARWGWGLNYRWSRMSVSRGDNVLSYRSQRFDRGGRCDVDAIIGEPVTVGIDSSDHCGAIPGTLEHFLAERYLLYTARGGRIWRGQVHHTPYPLYEARLQHLHQTLLDANGIVAAADPCHVLYSPGVSVEVFGLQPIATLK